jgi:hypothetical protein
MGTTPTSRSLFPAKSPRPPLSGTAPALRTRIPPVARTTRCWVLVGVGPPTRTATGRRRMAGRRFRRRCHRGGHEGRMRAGRGRTRSARSAGRTRVRAALMAPGRRRGSVRSRASAALRRPAGRSTQRPCAGMVPRLPPENPFPGLTNSDKRRSSAGGVWAGQCPILTINDKPANVAVVKRRFWQQMTSLEAGCST